MNIAVISPHTRKSGNTVSSILLSMGLSELKRKVLLTHIRPQSDSFYSYLGLVAYEDKTSTPSQLVKLMREGAIKPEEIGDYCKSVMDYLDVFTNKESNFSESDMSTLLTYLLSSSLDYEYLVFDVDEDVNNETVKYVLKNSHIVIFNLTASFVELDQFNNMKLDLMKVCRGKKILLLCSKYDHKVCKTKDIANYLGAKATCHVIRYNPWVQWSCNRGKLDQFFKQGKIKNPEVMEVYRDVMSLTSVVAKAKKVVGRELKGVFK